MANKLQVTELDFDDIKNNLKTYLKNQNEFTDYNFEGSGLSTIIDLLAYNTHYLAMNANMAVNESFLDTATLRSSVVSHAKTLGYTPRSVRAPVAYLDVVINNSNLTSLTMNKGTKFTTQMDGTAYSFITNEDFSQTPINGILRFSNVPVYEGSLVYAKYTVDATQPEKRYLITNNRADTSTLKVSVQASSTNNSTEVYTLATDITEVTANSNSYFLQEVEDGRFEVYFGDGVIGKSPTNGNIICLEYIVTNSDKANGAKSFSATTIGGQTDYDIATLIEAKGGADAETIQSIKYNAPLDFASQGRAVTTEDYKLVLPKVYPDVRAVQVWGGEDNDPPVYGQVFLSVKTNSGINLTVAQKNTIAKAMDKFNVASVRPSIIDPDITKLILGVSFKYNSNATTKSSGDLEAIVRNSITNYNTQDLDKFDVVFRYSKLSRLVDSSDSSILSSITNVRMRNSIIPILNTPSEYVINFNNNIHYPLENASTVTDATLGVEVVTSTGFTVAGDTKTMYLEDDGTGTLRRYYITGGTTKNFVDNSAGTVDYANGKVVITSLNVTGSSNSDGTISITVKPESNDVVSVRNQLLEIDLSNLIITGSNDTIKAGGSSAGTNYATSSSY
jgi:hypothetical protein